MIPSFDPHADTIKRFAGGVAGVNNPPDQTGDGAPFEPAKQVAGWAMARKGHTNPPRHPFA